MGIEDLVGLGGGDASEASESEDDVEAEDRPMEPHAVLEGEATSIRVLVVDERTRRLAGIPLRLLANDGTTIDKTTDESGIARWEDLSKEQTWQLTTPETPSEMRRQETLGFVALEEDDESEQELNAGDEEAEEEGEEDESEQEEAASTEASSGSPGAGLGLGGGGGLGIGGVSGDGASKSVAPSAPSAPSAGGLIATAAKVVTDALGGAIKGGLSASIGGGVGGSASTGAAAGAAAGGAANTFGGGFSFGDDSAGIEGDAAGAGAGGSTPDHVVPDDFDPLAGPALTYVAVVERIRVKTGDSLDTLASAAGIVAHDVTRFNWDTTAPGEIQRKLRWEVGCATDGDYADNLQLDDFANPGVVYVPRQLAQPVEVGKQYKLQGRSVQPFFLVLKSQSERPIPDAKYTLTFADGSTRSGTLTEHGVALIENPPWGTVQVEYDEPDDLRAKALAGDARQAIEARDPDALYDVLSEDPDELRAAVTAYNAYFNDFTGGGLSADIDAIVSDKDARTGLDLLLNRVDETLGEGTA